MEENNELINNLATWNLSKLDRDVVREEGQKACERTQEYIRGEVAKINKADDLER